MGTTTYLQPERGAFIDGFITPILEEGDHFLALLERSNKTIKKYTRMQYYSTSQPIINPDSR